MRQLSLALSLLLLASCEGLFDDIYDAPLEEEGAGKEQLYIDASSWTEWHYIDFEAIADSLQSNSLYNPSSAVVTYAIPTEAIEGDGKSGIYTYWYDVFGAGISNHEFRNFTTTKRQEEPVAWSIAIHRNNVRTNGGSVYETPYTSMSDLPESSEAFKNAAFTEDAWNEKDVWTVQDRMLQGLIGNQGIHVNQVLSAWLKVHIPPVPPVFTLNSHVFVLKLKNGTCAALQLENYQNTAGKKCFLTINYKYPY